MSSLSGGIKDEKYSYIHLILYQSLFCNNTQNIKNIFPYGISIQFDNNSEKFIDSIKNINEIFNSSQNEFKYVVNNNQHKHLIKINCYIKSQFVAKKIFASVKIAVNPLNLIKNNKEKNVKKWYYLKNKNGELMLKLLLSIDIYSMLNLSNNIQNDNKNKNYSHNYNNKNEFNSSNNIKIHLNSISNNNLNGIPSSTYISTSHYISSSNNSFKSSSTKTNNSIISTPININNQNSNLNNRVIIYNNNNNNNLLTSIIEKDDSMTICENDNNEKVGDLNANNYNLALIVQNVQNFLEKSNQKLFIKTKNLIQKKQHLSKEENNYFKSKKKLVEDNTKLNNDIKILEKKRLLYENKYLDAIDNNYKNEKKIYKSNIEKELNIYEKDILLSLNHIYINQQKSDEIMLDEKMNQNYISQYSMKNFKDNEKSVINNYYNNKGYSFESNNYKNSLYLHGNGGNSNKVLFNIVYDNKSIINIPKNMNHNNYNYKPSPISFKYKGINKEYSVSVSDSNSPSRDEVNNNNFNRINYNSSRRNSKKRLITDYSKSTLNILDDLHMFDEITDININKASKSNDIIQNNLTLNIPKISNLHRNNNKNKYIDGKKNNKVIQNNNMNKKNLNNLIQNKNKRKKIKINDDNNSSYYRLENKYYSTTTTNNNSKNKDLHKLNKKTASKKIENTLTKKNVIPSSKNSYNSFILSKKLDNNTLMIGNEEGNESKNNLNNNNKVNGKNKNSNRVFKNIFMTKKPKDKEISKNNKVNSLVIECLENNVTNNSISKSESNFPEKLTSIDNNKAEQSRNVKYIQYNKNFNKNIKNKKSNKNYIKLHKKADINNDNDRLINHFCYNNESSLKSKNINTKLSFYSNNNTLEQKNDSNINLGLPSKKISQKNTNFKYNTIDCNLTNKNANNNKIKNKIISNNANNKVIVFQNKKNINNITLNSKLISNIDGNNNSKISFYIRKNNTISDCHSNNNKNKNNANNKIINNKNLFDNNMILKNVKNKNNKVQKNKFNQTLNSINSSHLKPIKNINNNKNSFFSLINNHII